MVNPLAASGGQDAETGSAARENAPRTVLTLDRAVSLQDYEDFARSFAGLAKAHAVWIKAGPGRGVYISIAGVAGAAVPSTSTTYLDLLDALRQYGDLLLPLRLANYRPATFKLAATIKVYAEAESAQVLADAEDLLRATFAFDKRRFGQMVSVDEIMGVLHSLSGVEAVNVLSLYRPDQGTTPRLEPRLFARLPVTSLTTLPQAAELLLLDAGPLSLKEMT